MRTFQSLLTVYCRIRGEKKSIVPFFVETHEIDEDHHGDDDEEAHENVEKNNQLRLICTMRRRRKKKPSRIIRAHPAVEEIPIDDPAEGKFFR